MPNETRRVNWAPPLPPLGGRLVSTKRYNLSALGAAANVSGLRIVLLTLGQRAKWLAFNRQVLPELEAFPAVDGFDKRRTLHVLAQSGLRYHKLTLPNYGSLACYLTKYLALQEQVARRIPYQLMMEDDLMVQDTFRGFAHELVRAHFERPPPTRRDAPADLVVLGRWGEGYLTSLAGARRVLSRLRLNGIRRGIDIQLNDGSCGVTVQLAPNHVPWSYFRPPNKGLIRLTARGLNLTRVPPTCADYMPLAVCGAGQWGSGNCTAARRDASRRVRAEWERLRPRQNCAVTCGLQAHANCTPSPLCLEGGGGESPALPLVGGVGVRTVAGARIFCGGGRAGSG